MKTDSLIQLTSKGIAAIPFIGNFLESAVCLKAAKQAPKAIAGWGKKPSGYAAERLAAKSGLPCWHLEDAFLRSYATGDKSPPLGLVVDQPGIYYDSTGPSALENLLNSDADLLAEIADQLQQAKSLILEQRLSKYNHAPDLRDELSQPQAAAKVLVIDQTAGDMSVSLGGANAETFESMLKAAYAENPGATIYLKTHPEVSSGRKGGYLTHIQDDVRTVVLRQAINPLSLIERMDRVYVVTSTMGFEAILAGKPVTVFGMPWYAGWGVTDDRQTYSRRTKQRSVDELFAAAYFHYARYLNPVTHRLGSIFDVIDWLIRQRQIVAKYPGRMIAVGVRRWKAVNLQPLLALDHKRVLFVDSVEEARALSPKAVDCLLFWGQQASDGLLALAEQSGARVLHMEDGFIRSVGLDLDFVKPLSIVLDQQGIYFDPTRPSDLEDILNQRVFSDEDLNRAGKVREFIVAHRISKYNIEPLEKAEWPSAGKTVVLVPGQVEDDASIRFGCTDIHTNLGLLQAARLAHPDAFIVYKPHPDVKYGKRKGDIQTNNVLAFADYVEEQLSVISCLEACNVVHTMTSLTGFDALLRNKRVVVYGQPFYAGWGLTDDVLQHAPAFDRRKRRLSLDELVAGALLHYPLYWDWDLKGYTSCEAVLHRIVEMRQASLVDGRVQYRRLGYIRRQCRKLHILLQAWKNRR